MCVCQDGGGLNSTASLTVSVSNSAGQPPVFLQSRYNGTVYENAELVSAATLRITRELHSTLSVLVDTHIYNFNSLTAVLLLSQMNHFTTVNIDIE